MAASLPHRFRNAKPRSKPYKVFDSGGLYLLINPEGARYWRVKYRLAGKERLLALGVYPDVSLAEAQTGRDEAKRLLREGKDPVVERKAAKLRDERRHANTFEAVADEWLSKKASAWTPTHAERVRASLALNLYPELGARPIADLTAAELLAALRKIEARDAHELRERVQQRAGMVFRYAIATGRCERDPVADLRGAFTAPTRFNYAALDKKDLPEFFAKLEAYDGEPSTKLAIRLLLLTFVRTGELRGARWDEIDFDRATWEIPAARMKMRLPHVVPLSTQALAVLRELHTLSGSGELVFPSRSKPKQPISENTILYALYRMGYHGRATGHGFRATASTILHEAGFAPDWIERQLAHAGTGVRAVYNKAQHLRERAGMMQHWADLLDGFRDGGRKVVSGRFRKAVA